MAASRALQLTFEGFRSAVAGDPPSVTMVLDSLTPEEARARHAGPSVEQKDLLDLAKPSQVLITQALYDRMDRCQPLALRSFPARAGVYEFLWTSIERLDTLRAATRFVPALVTEPEPVADAQDTIISRPVLDAPQPPPMDLAPPAESPFVSVYRKSNPERPPRRMIAIGVSAAILAAVGGLVIWQASIGNLFKPLQPNSGIRQTIPPPTPPPVPPGPKPGPVTPVPDPLPLPPPPPPKPPKATQCDISVPDTLKYAEKNRNNGAYTEAVREYKDVLKCEPTNAIARRGLSLAQEDERIEGIRE